MRTSTLRRCGLVLLPLTLLGCAAESDEPEVSAFGSVSQALASGSHDISSQINAPDNDAEERLSGSGPGTVSLGSSDLELARDGSREQLIGMRFTQGLNIPKNSTITSAHIEFTVKDARSSFTALSFFGQKEGSLEPFARTEGNLFWRTELSSSKTQVVPWTYSGGANDPSTGAAGTKFESPDLSGVVQEIVDASNWQEGQTPILLYVSGNGSGYRRAWSFNGSAQDAPVLHIDFEAPACANGETRHIPCGPSGSGDLEQTCSSSQWVDGACVVSAPSGPTTVTSSPAQSSDDAEQVTNEELYTSSSDLELVDDPLYGGNGQRIGIRFPSLDVPQGATITSAYINFTPKASNDGLTNLFFRGQYVDDAPTFSTQAGNDVTSRFAGSLTGNGTDWSNVSSWTASGNSSTERSPDLKLIVEEIVSRSGWQRNNALVMLISGDGKRNAASWDHSDLNPPQLVVTYETGDSTAHTCVAPSINNIPPNIQATGCVDLSNPRFPAAGVFPYGVNHTFWSNGALKERWYSLPPGSTIDATVSSDWELPKGAVTIKHFFNPDTGNLFETRFYVRHAQDGYHGYTYRWTNFTTALLVDGATGVNEDEEPGLAPDGWRYPDDVECRKCHNNSVNGIIGFSQQQFNLWSWDFEVNLPVNQIDKMISESKLTNVDPNLDPESAKAFDASPYDSGLLDSNGQVNDWVTDDQLDWAARSYLDVNCSYCHNKQGYDPGLNPELRDKFFEGSWDGRIETDIADTGLCNRSFIPGMIISKSMPEVGISEHDEYGVNLLTAWFNSAGFCSAP